MSYQQYLSGESAAGDQLVLRYTYSVYLALVLFFYLALVLFFLL